MRQTFQKTKLYAWNNKHKRLLLLLLLCFFETIPKWLCYISKGSQPFLGGLLMLTLLITARWFLCHFEKPWSLTVRHSLVINLPSCTIKYHHSLLVPRSSHAANIKLWLELWYWDNYTARDSWLSQYWSNLLRWDHARRASARCLNSVVLTTVT